MPDQTIPSAVIPPYPFKTGSIISDDYSSGPDYFSPAAHIPPTLPSRPLQRYQPRNPTDARDISPECFKISMPKTLLKILYNLHIIEKTNTQTEQPLDTSRTSFKSC